MKQSEAKRGRCFDDSDYHCDVFCGCCPVALTTLKGGATEKHSDGTDKRSHSLTLPIQGNRKLLESMCGDLPQVSKEPRPETPSVSQTSRCGSRVVPAPPRPLPPALIDWILISFPSHVYAVH